MLTWISWPNSSWVNYTLFEYSPLFQLWRYLMLFFAFPLKILLEFCCCCVACQKCMCNNFRLITHKSTHKCILNEHRSSNVWIWLVLLLLLMLLLFLLFSDTIYYYWVFFLSSPEIQIWISIKIKTCTWCSNATFKFWIQIHFKARLSMANPYWDYSVNFPKIVGRNCCQGCE